MSARCFHLCIAGLLTAAFCGPTAAGPGEWFGVTLTNGGGGNTTGVSLTDDLGNNGQALPSLLGRGVVSSHSVRFAAAGYQNDRFLLDPVEAGELARLNFVFTENNQLTLGSGRGPKAEVENRVNVSVGAQAFSYYHRRRIGSQDDETIVGAMPASATLAVRGGDFVALNVAGQTYAHAGDFPDLWSPVGARGGASLDNEQSSAISDLKLDYELTLFEDRRHWAPDTAGVLAEATSWVEQAAPDATSWAVFNRTSPRSLTFKLDAGQRWRGLIVDGESLTLDLNGRTVETTTSGASQKNYGVLVGEGRHGPSALTLRNGRLDVANHIIVGADAAPATLTVGAGAAVDAAGALQLATRVGATADLRIEDGGSLRARGLEIAALAGSRGTLRIDGSGSMLTVDAASAGIGRAGLGELLVHGGGQVQWHATIVDIGSTSAHAAALRVVGAGSQSVDGSFNVGNGAVLEVRDGALLRSKAGGVQVTAGGSFFASAATVELGRLDVGPAGASALFDRGTQASASEVTVRGGSLRIVGAGTRLGGVENLMVHAGNLEIGDGAVLSGDAAYIAEGARLSGDGGTLDFDRKLLADGTVAPGHSPGRMTITGSFELGATGVLELEIAGLGAGSEHDQLFIGGDAVLGGRVALLFLDGFAPKTGDRFDLLVVGGSFAGGTGLSSLSISGLADGWLYSVDFDVTSGGLALTSLSDAVAAVPEPPTGLLLLAGVLVVALRRRQSLQLAGATTR